MVRGRGAGSGTYLGAAGNRPPLRLGHGQGAGHIPRSPHKVRLVSRAPPPAAARWVGVWGEGGVRIWANEVWAGDFGSFRVIGGEKGRLADRVF